jgi:hypothetical protein
MIFFKTSKENHKGCFHENPSHIRFPTMEEVELSREMENEITDERKNVGVARLKTFGKG